MRPTPPGRCSDQQPWVLRVHCSWFLPLFCFCREFAEGCHACVGHLHPLAVRRGLSFVVVVPVPPLVGRGLWVTFWRVFPGLLTAERREVKVAPGGAHRLVAAAVDEVRAKHLLTVVEEHVVPMPFIHAEVRVEAVSDGVPGNLPVPPRLEPCDVGLGCGRGVDQGGIAGVQMGQVSHLVGAEGTAAAGVLGPAENSGLKEGAIDDQLTAALDQIEQTYLALGAVELVLLLNCHPGHAPAFCGQRITGAGKGLLLYEELLVRSLPLLLRYDRGCGDRGTLFARCHAIAPLFLEMN